MLKTIDILLGVTVVMLIVSMCVTMITQALIRLRDARGKKLLEGLAGLMQQIDPSLDRALAQGVAGALLRHPLVSEGSQRLGSTIHREEFTTLLCSFVVAFALQLDVVGLMNRLSVDPALRQALVTQATTTAGAAQSGTGDPLDRLQNLTGQSREDLQGLAQIGAVTLPGKDWVANWGISNTLLPYGCAAGAPCPAKVNLLGVILSALMLSLGAPFWYNALRNLVRLRSVVASKDDDQRATRQTTQVPVTAVAGGAAGLPRPPV